MACEKEDKEAVELLLSFRDIDVNAKTEVSLFPSFLLDAPYLTLFFLLRRD